MNHNRVMQPGTLLWFARHEARLAWRDWSALMTGGRRRRAILVAVGLLVFAAFMHALAYGILAPSGNLRAADQTTGVVVAAADPTMAVVVAGTLVLVWSLMLAQAMESVTRAFYARGDLELILTSPANAARLFAVRITGLVVAIMTLALVLQAPFINVMAWLGGPRWLSGYAVSLAMAMDAVAVAVVFIGALFRAIGPRRTRSLSQVAAAVIGAAFAIGVQLAALLSYGTTSVPRWVVLAAFAPDPDSPLLWPARAVAGEPVPLAMLLGLSTLALAGAIGLFAPRFGPLVLATASEPVVRRAAASELVVRRAARRRSSRLRATSAAQALRRKEWMLLLRDPWLMSQTLMQLLYLLPPAFLLWRNFYSGDGASALLVPLLIVAAGQLGGGLAWLAVSAEDAPELIATAPVPTARVFRAKTEAVLGGIGVIFGPFVIALAFAAPLSALVTAAGIVIAAGSGTAIQFWFRTQVKRSAFRRRQTSSRVATFAEALSSTGWAGTGALAAGGSWAAIVPGVLVLVMLAGVWLLSPARA